MHKVLEEDKDLHQQDLVVHKVLEEDKDLHLREIKEL